jgi:hypothetical protein
MPKQFDVTITIPLHLHNVKTMAEAKSCAASWARRLASSVSFSSAYANEPPTITVREVKTP